MVFIFGMVCTPYMTAGHIVCRNKWWIINVDDDEFVKGLRANSLATYNLFNARLEITPLPFYWIDDVRPLDRQT